MILYSGPLSMFGAQAQIAVLEKGLEADVEMVPFSLRDFYSPKHPEVVRINPKQQVPVLKDSGLELFDSTLIFEYLDDAYPDTPLWPACVADRARARQLELKSDEVFFGDVQKLMPAQRAAADAEPVGDVVVRLEAFCEEMNQLLSTRDYLAGEFSYADIAFFPAQFFAGFLGAQIPDRCAHLLDWRTRMTARESVQSVMGAIAGYLTEQGLPTSL